MLAEFEVELTSHAELDISENRLFQLLVRLTQVDTTDQAVMNPSNP